MGCERGGDSSLLLFTALGFPLLSASRCAGAALGSMDAASLAHSFFLTPNTTPPNSPQLPTPLPPTPPQTQFDALAAAMTDNTLNGEWPYRRMDNLVKEPQSLVSHLGRHGELIYSDKHLSVLLGDVDVEQQQGSPYDFVAFNQTQTQTQTQTHTQTQTQTHTQTTSRRLAKREGMTDKSVTFVYVSRERPGNVFTDANMMAIRELETSLYSLPKYKKATDKFGFCR